MNSKVVLYKKHSRFEGDERDTHGTETHCSMVQYK